MLALLLAVSALLPRALAQSVNCNACKDPCGAFDVLRVCDGRKKACFAIASPMAAWTQSVEAACSNDPSRLDDQARIEAAKDMLINGGDFERSEFDGVHIRWCSLLDGAEGYFSAEGMAPSSGKILLHTDYLATSIADLAVLLAHEMCHIRQYRKWESDDGFRCRYMQAGLGNNWIERECDAADASVKLSRCFTVKNRGASTRWAAFQYNSRALERWAGRGWYAIEAEDARDFCFTRHAYMYAHFYNDGSPYSYGRTTYDSTTDTTNCITDAGHFQTVHNYEGYAYYDLWGELAGDSCDDAEGYYLAQFVHLTGGEGQEYASTTIGRRLQTGLGLRGVAGGGAGGQHGGAEELEVRELSVEEVGAVMHGGRGGRGGARSRPVFVDREEDGESDVTVIE